MKGRRTIGMIRKLGLIVIVLVVLALFASGCTQQLAGNDTRTSTTPRPTVTLGAANRSDAGAVGGAAATVTTAAAVGNGATGSMDRLPP